MNLKKIIDEEYKNSKPHKITRQKKFKEKSIIDIHREWLHHVEKDPQYTEDHYTEDYYSSALKRIIKSNTDYKPEYLSDHAELMQSLLYDPSIKNIQYSGLFFSALINNHFKKTEQTEEYVLVLPSELPLLNHLGYKNKGANIRIRGNTGNFLCERMKKGTVIVEGNTEHFAGDTMQGGTLYVKKAKMNFADKMRGGVIYADEISYFGHGIEKGEIHVAGGELLNVNDLILDRCTLFYKGKQITYPKRKMNFQKFFQKELEEKEENEKIMKKMYDEFREKIKKIQEQ